MDWECDYAPAPAPPKWTVGWQIDLTIKGTMCRSSLSEPSYVTEYWQRDLAEHSCQISCNSDCYFVRNHIKQTNKQTNRHTRSQYLLVEVMKCNERAHSGKCLRADSALWAEGRGGCQKVSETQRRYYPPEVMRQSYKYKRIVLIDIIRIMQLKKTYVWLVCEAHPRGIGMDTLLINLSPGE